MKNLQLRFPFMDDDEPRLTVSNDNLPVQADHTPNQPVEPLRAIVASPCASHHLHIINR